MSEIQVKGLADLNKFLQQLPAKVEANVLRGALREGANVVKAEARRRVPVGKPSAKNVRIYGGYEGALRDSIRVSVRSKGGRVVASVKAGGKDAKHHTDTYYAYWLEYTGAAAHMIRAKKGGALSVGGKLFRKVMHPGFKAKPFLRPALQAASRAAVVAAANYMKRRLAMKHGLDTSGVEISAEGE